SGIKRHIAADTQGLPHAIAVTTAEATDCKGALLALQGSFAWPEKNRRLWKNCERKRNASLQLVHPAFPAVLLKKTLNRL
ncbi:transposase, partial [Xanthomonas theicola]